MTNTNYVWTDNPTVSGVSKCDTDVLNDCLMHLKYCKSTGANIFDLKISDYLLSFEESKGWALQGTYVYKNSLPDVRYGYAGFYQKCVEEKTNAVITDIVLGDSEITVYSCTNGHVYYDISDKPIVDAFYETYGACWFYGIDTENERIFLPRNDWYFKTDNKAGEFIEAGLPNITGVIGATGQSGAGYGVFYKPANSGAFGVVGSPAQYSVGNGAAINSRYINADFDASRVSSVYGKSNTVQPPSVSAYLYICVGNTDENISTVGVSEITTTANDTIPLGYCCYQPSTIGPSPAWLLSNGQYNDGTVYATFYNWLVNRLGSDDKVKNYGDSTVSDYDFVLKQDEMAFRLPLKITNEPISEGLDLYFKVGNALQNVELLEVDEILSALTHKVGFEDKQIVTEWSVPKYDAGIALVKTANYQNEISQTGWVLFNAAYKLGNDSAYIKKGADGVAYEVAACHNSGTSYYDGSHAIYPVVAGDIVYNTSGLITMTFFPSNGG